MSTINKKEIEILSKKGEQRVPVEGEMVNMAARKISTSLTKSIKDYAR